MRAAGQRGQSDIHISSGDVPRGKCKAGDQGRAGIDLHSVACDRCGAVRGRCIECHADDGRLGLRHIIGGRSSAIRRRSKIRRCRRCQRRRFVKALPLRVGDRGKVGRGTDGRGCSRHGCSGRIGNRSARAIAHQRIDGCTVGQIDCGTSPRTDRRQKISDNRIRRLRGSQCTARVGRRQHEHRGDLGGLLLHHERIAIAGRQRIVSKQIDTGQTEAVLNRCFGNRHGRSRIGGHVCLHQRRQRIDDRRTAGCFQHNCVGNPSIDVDAADSQDSAHLGSLQRIIAIGIGSDAGVLGNVGHSVGILVDIDPGASNVTVCNCTAQRSHERPNGATTT